MNKFILFLTLSIFLALSYFISQGTEIVSYLGTRFLYPLQIFLFPFLYYNINKEFKFDIFMKILIFNSIYLILRIPGMPELHNAIMGLTLPIQYIYMHQSLNKSKFHKKEFVSLYLIYTLFPVMVLFQENPDLASGVYLPSLVSLSESFMITILLSLVFILCFLAFLFKFIRFSNLNKTFFILTILIMLLSINFLSLQSGENYGVFYLIFSIVPSLVFLKKSMIDFLGFIVLSIISLIFYNYWDYFLLDRGLELGGNNDYSNVSLILNSLFYTFIYYAVYLKISLWKQYANKNK